MMNGQGVLEMWVETDLIWVHENYEQDYTIDIPARNESFNNFVDSLLVDGIITESLAGEVCLPDIFEKNFHPTNIDGLMG